MNESVSEMSLRDRVIVSQDDGMDEGVPVRMSRLHCISLQMLEDRLGEPLAAWLSDDEDGEGAEDAYAWTDAGDLVYRITTRAATRSLLRKQLTTSSRRSRPGKSKPDF